MSGARHREEGRLRGRTAIYRPPTMSPAALIAMPVWMLIGQIRSAGLETGIIRALGRVIAWHFLTFLVVMVGSMADHYEYATDENNDSPHSNTYDAAPANPVSTTTRANNSSRSYQRRRLSFSLLATLLMATIAASATKGAGGFVIVLALTVTSMRLVFSR